MKAIFMDRDGTINIEKNYVYKISDFEFIPGAREAILSCNQLGYSVIVVTNQSGIAKGYYTEKDLHRLHQYINESLLELGAHIDRFYYCPHHPTQGVLPYRRTCDCRKPNVGMFQQAMRDFSIDPSQSWVVGDRLRDLSPADSFGMKKALVLTGYGKQESKNIPSDVSCYTDLLDFVSQL